MPIKNRCQKCSKISERKFREILRCFALDITASSAAEQTSVSVRSVNAIFLKLRGRIAEECGKKPPFQGVAELDEPCFCPKRICGRRGGGAVEKAIASGIFKRGGKAYAEIVPDAPAEPLVSVMGGLGKRDLRRWLAQL